MEAVSQEEQASGNQLDELEALLDKLRGVVDTARRANESPGEEDADFKEVCEDISQLCGEIESTAQAEVMATYDHDAPFVWVKGTLYRRLDTREPKSYHFLRGKRRIERHIYREVGVHNGSTVCPMELRAGMVGGRWSPQAAETIAFFTQQLPSRPAKKMAQHSGVLPYSRSSFARMADELANRWEARREYLEDCIAVAAVPAETASVSVGIDRVSLPMVIDGSIDYKMAWCGTVTMHDAEGRPLQTRRIGFTDDREADFRRRLNTQVEAVLAQCDDNVPLVALSDGEHYLCDILDGDYGERVVARCIDIWHLAEKLSAALYALDQHCQTTRSPDQARRSWMERLYDEDDAIDAIERAIRRWPVDEHLEVASNKPIRAALTYIDNHREQMRYASLVERGLPIATGHVEATCKQLFALRLKRNGQRWGYEGAQSILDLRSLALSDQWAAAMELLADEYCEEVTPAYSSYPAAA